jgi:hypothetical protein
MSIIVVYHKGCMDGFGAALVAWKKFGGEASYIPVSYGTEQDSFVREMAKAAEHPLSELYVLDFSFNAGQLRRLAKIFGKITILDHHDTARKELMEERKIGEQRGANVWVVKQEIEDLGNVSLDFDMDRAGCQLTWDHFFQPFQTINRETSRPEFINFLGWRDLWWHKRRDAYKKYADAIEALHLYLDTMPFSFESWAKFCDEPQDAVLKGMPIVAYQKQQLRKAAANCVECVVNWTRDGTAVAEQVALVNAPQFMASDLAEVVYERTSANAYKMVAIWCTGKDGDVTVSVRSRERPGDIHCGNFAKLYGGGGHPGAAGFDISLEQLTKIFLPLPNRSFH